MADYQPLDLSAYLNASTDVLGDHRDAPLGKQSFHGLPFQIGGDGGDCFILLDGESDPVTVPIDQSAHTIVFAHCLLESKLMEGGPVGVEACEYVFHMPDKPVRAPCRERFEISTVPHEWGQQAFLSLPDAKHELMPRHEGSWNLMGRRQIESIMAVAQGYYLWVWRNPRPDAPISALEIVPKGPKFIVAAITLGKIDEHPFARQGRRETRIVLTDPADAEKPFDVDVEVDRGVATYVHPLPDSSSEEFLNQSFKGWGEAQSDKSSPSYVEIAATPSATVKVSQSGKEVGAVRWGEVEEKGSASTPKMRVELLDKGRNWVHVTVLDDETGKPVPCRVHFRSPEGIPYQPHGHHNQVNSNLESWHSDIGGEARLGQITYAYIDGKCQGWLPRGDVIVDVARGFEYEPLREKVSIKPGQRDVTLRLKRWTNMNAKGWYSGDSHVHFLSVSGSHTESQGEDLNVVNLLASQWGSLFTNAEDFTGGPSIRQDGNNIVYCSQENRQHLLGHLILWGLKEPVSPWCSDGPGEAEIGGTLETTMSDWADRTHAQGGTVVIPHLPSPNGEPAALIATGRADAVEMLRHGDYPHTEYYRYLNCGYRLPLVGGTDKMSSDVPVGIYRTYVQIPDNEEFTYENWCKNVSRGRTFHSGGPIIHFSVEGRPIGDTLELSGPGTVEVEAWAESIFPIHTLQIVQQGRVVASSDDRNGARRLELKAKIKVEGHSWLAARCSGPDYASVAHHDGWQRGIFAHTSPIYVACGGPWHLFDEATANYMLTLVDGNLSYIRQMAPQHAPETVTHHHGREDHQKYLEEPFLQAREALHRRLHQHGVPH
jgi:hypothetical protein